MKHLRLYEEINQGKPEVGDYVYITADYIKHNYKEIWEYIQDKIGKIIGVERAKGASSDHYLVE